jgi:Protein of unknown function (DUF3987)/Primase C terminal 2 (PriCT-2)
MPFEKIAVTFVAKDGGKDPKIEVLGKGQQFIVHGIHPDTREPYAWQGGELWNTAHEKLPTISEQEARDFIKDATKMLVEHFGFEIKIAVKDHDNTDDRQSSDPNADIETLRRALDVIPNNYDWDGWNRVGMALWRATNGSGFNLFDAWSQKSSNYVAATTSVTWNGYFRSPPTRLGAGTIILLANEHSPNWRYGFFSGKEQPYTESPSIDPEEEPQQQQKHAGQSEPLPLYPPLPPAEPYPVDALGTILARAACAISRKIQVPEAIAAQSVLSVACLAARAVADVRLPFGQIRPLSCYFVTVAQTGDRKTSADSEASSAIRRREADLRETFKEEMAEHKARMAAYLAVKKGVENAKGQTVEEKMQDIMDLGQEPQPPLSPFLTAPDPTIEGLLKAWKHAPASLGLFSAEGGQFVGGHGMTDEAKLRTAAALSELWDGVPPKRIRAGDGVSILPGRRLALHMLVQPEASAVFLSDRALKDQGLLSRVLSAAPESIAGTRFYKAPQASDDAAIRDFERVIFNILSGHWPLTDGSLNELAPPALDLDPAARDEWIRFIDRIERKIGKGGDLLPVIGLAAKAGEHVARLGGVMTVIHKQGATTIGVEAIRSAIVLMDWYLREALRLSAAALTDPDLVLAQTLLTWLQERTPITKRDVLRLGPSKLRTKAVLDKALAMLEEHRWINVSPGAPYLVTK